ncbi:MAG: acetate/propionate family kinase [Rhodobacteraceae bacterium]|nr:acetate/propionate family kinase [Paracoccaceae bacterium]
MAGDPWILTLNAGSSSLKFAAFTADCMRISSGQVTSSLQEALTQLNIPHPPLAVGHRVVHGGSRNAPALITPPIRSEIEANATLAPLHNPPALKVIDAVRTLYPNVPQYACFDTAFHANNPPEATTIPIPQSLRDQGIKRYGFHGLSYASLVRRFEQITTTTLPRRVLAFHLGAGASLAAIVDGVGVANTMGFSPMDGLVMATRAGAMDTGVVLHLMREHGMSSDAIDQMLNHESGLAAMAGTADMKAILNSNNPSAKFAVSHYCYWVSRHAGSMIAAMQGVDGFIFTGGIGENAAQIREQILNRLSWAGELPHWVIPADEEGEIAHAARPLIN